MATMKRRDKISNLQQGDDRLARRVRDRKRVSGLGGGMIWGSSDKRSDPYSTQSESGLSEVEEGCRRSKRSEKRSKKGKRGGESKKNSSWFGGLVGYTKPSTRKQNSKKSKKSRTKEKCKKSKSATWGKMVLGALLIIYLLNFFNVLYSKRPKAASPISSAKDQSEPAPVNAASVSTTSTTNRNSSQATTHQSEPQADAPTAVHQSLSQDGEKASDQSQGGGDSSQASNSNSAAQQSSSESSNPGTKQVADSPSNGAGQETSADQSPKVLEKHPMNRNMLELQIPGNTGVLTDDKVKDYYRSLAKAYLLSFTGGIHRQMFFDILRRRTYSLTPPGANKGIQTILFQIIDKKVYMMDPYEVPRNSKPFYRTRINQVIWLLSKLCQEGRIKNTEFLMAIHDCVQTVNKPHTYRGAHFSESNPAFTIVSCNFSDNIPFPMWEGTKHRDGGFQGWDETMKTYAADDIPWDKKQDRAVFRGGNRPSMYFMNKTDADLRCNDVGRTRLLYLAEQQPDAFDVSVGGTCGGKRTALNRLDAKEHHKFKYILYAEGNCMWADRSKQQVFGPSAMIKQETPCGQFFEPLLKPEVHYIPTNFFFTDTIEKIKWARQNDEVVHQLVKNANEFARNFLSLKGVETYVEILLEEYTSLLVEPDVKLENGAIDVTDKEV